MPILDHPLLPRWVRRFIEDPDASLDQLLRGAFYAGASNVVDPGDLLIDWIGRYAEDLEVGALFDERLAAWLVAHWDDPEQDDADTVVAADAWVRALNAVAYLDDVPNSAGVLRSRFSDREDRFDGLIYGRSRDPLGRYLFAVAQHQDDRQLVPVWMRICELGPSVPLWHGAYGLEGVRRAHSSAGESFPRDVATALLTLAEGLAAAVQQNRISADSAKLELFSLIDVTVDAYSDDGGWESLLSKAAADTRRLSREWLTEIARERSSVQSNVGRAAPKAAPADYDDGSDLEAVWAARAADIATRMSASDEAAVNDAADLLDTERAYARQTGISQPLVLSLVRFARLLEPKDPKRADAWCSEARQWQPWNPYCWVVGLRARRRFDPPAAADIGWGAVERFPDNPLAVRELAVALVMNGLPDEAETVAAAGLGRFPAHVHLLDILSDALARQGRMDEAKAVLSQHPLAALPESMYERRIERIKWLSAKGDLPVAADHATTLEPSTHTASRSRILRRSGSVSEEVGGVRARVGELIDNAMEARPSDPRLASEKALQLLADMQIDAASETVESRPRSRRHPSLAYARVRVWRASAQAEERTYRDGHEEAEDLSAAFGQVNPENLPLAHLATLRSMAALSDGRVKSKDLEERGNALDAWMKRITRLQPAGSADSEGQKEEQEDAISFLPTQLASRAFLTWWSDSVNRLVLEPAAAAGGSGQALELALARNAGELDALEEDFVARATVGA